MSGFSWRSAAPRTLGAVACAVLAAGCGTGNAARHPQPRAGGRTVTVAQQGYRFGLAVAGLRKAATVATTDTGRLISTPPGRALVLAAIAYRNTTGRSEPWEMYPRSAPVGESMPYPAVGLYMMVPARYAARFGISPGSQLCSANANSGGSPVRAGYCNLQPMVVGARPAPDPATGQVPQLAPGATATVILAVAGPAGNGVPAAAPLNVIRVYFGSCASGSSACLAQVPRSSS